MPQVPLNDDAKRQAVEIYEDALRQWCLKFAGTFTPAYDKILTFAEACEAFLKTGDINALRVVKGGK